MKAEWTNKDSLTSGETTKAILVVDKAESCTSCMLGIYNKKWFCLATNKDIDICDRYNIPTWCPLKPMPEKYIVHDITIETERDAAVCSHGITLGRNLLIEELEK